MGHTFLSYSRQQYYFAESLALHLQQRGLPVWFDIQQLEPGTNWAADIEDGLKRATSLTLIGSRAALSSPYVEREWRHALDAGKPIIVALYERTRLPADLRRRALVVDCRGSFEGGVRALEQRLRLPHPPRHPARGSLRWPRLPGGVRRMALALMLDDLRILLGFLAAVWVVFQLLAGNSTPRAGLTGIVSDVYQADLSPIFPLLLAGCGGLAAFLYLRKYPERLKAPFFLRHDFSYQTLNSQITPATAWRAVVWRWILLFGLIYTAASISKDSLQPVAGVLQDNNWLFALLLLLIFCQLLVPVVRRLAVPSPHADIVRWARLGQVPEAWRVQVNQHLIDQSSQLPTDAQVRQTGEFGRPQAASPPAAETAPRTYRVIHAPGDERAAEDVKQILTQIGFHQPDGDSPAACTALVLSYRTPLALARDCLQTQPGVVGVLATNVRLRDALPELANLQLVDYRRQDKQQLLAAFQLLVHDDDISRANSSLRLLPVNLSARVDIPALQSLFSGVVVLSIINLLYIAYYFSRLWLLSIPLVPVPAAFMPQAAGCAALLIINCLLWWFGLGVLRGIRRLPPRLLVMVAAAPLVIFVLVEISAPLSAPITTTLPLFGLVSTTFDQRPVWVIVIAYVIGLVWLLRHVFQTDLLVRAGTPVLGMRRIRPGWSSILSALIFILVVMAMSLVEEL